MIRAFVVALLLPGAAHAQGPPAPIPGASRHLDFGVVFAGVPESIAPSDSGAAFWGFRGTGGAAVTLTFTSLPSLLLLGTQALAVTYGPASAAWNTTDDPATAVPFDPTLGATATIGDEPNHIYVWLGATAVPTRAAPPGEYQATYTLDVSYARP